MKPIKCVALYDCQADQLDELTFKENDIIVIIKQQTDDNLWMEGYIAENPVKRGLVPESFVKMIDWNMELLGQGRYKIKTVAPFWLIWLIEKLLDSWVNNFHYLVTILQIPYFESDLNSYSLFGYSIQWYLKNTAVISFK